MSNGEGGFKCTIATDHWFSAREYGFTPHELRHAYTHRGHRLEINTDALCQGLGHGFEMNTTIYRNSKTDEVKLQDMLGAISKNKEKRSQLELFKDRVKDLEVENLQLRNENELLKTKLKMYEAIEQSKGQK